MADELPVATKGFRLQRHLDSLKSWSIYYAEDKKQKATVSTGLTIEYVVTTKDVEGATEDENVVLIMGFGNTKESWGLTVDQLRKNWTSPTKNLKILSFDNRGIGGTDPTWGRYTTSQMADDTLALMDHVGFESAHIIGVSMGGMIALELAANAPKRVRSLGLNVTTRGKYVQEEGKQDNSEMRKTMFSKDKDVIAAGVLKMLYPDAFLAQRMEDMDTTIRDELYNFHRGRLEVAPKKYMRGVIGQVLAIRTHWVSDERLAAIGQAGFPVLIIGGGDDRLIPGSESKVIADGMNASDRVKLIIMEDGGHGLLTQYVDEVIQEYLANFQRASL
jgi:pimeloyl-ACP methyl ester carboxylesterase